VQAQFRHNFAGVEAEIPRDPTHFGRGVTNSVRRDERRLQYARVLILAGITEVDLSTVPTPFRRSTETYDRVLVVHPHPI
jgi:hypothetical protein